MGLPNQRGHAFKTLGKSPTLISLPVASYAHTAVLALLRLWLYGEVPFGAGSCIFLARYENSKTSVELYLLDCLPLYVCVFPQCR